MTPENRRRAILVLCFIAALAIAGIGVYLSTILPPSPSRPCDVCKPSVSFGPPVAAPPGERVSVVGLAQGTANISSFRVNVEFNGSYGRSDGLWNMLNGSVLIPFPSLGPGTDNYTVRWTDADANGRLSVGDSFTVSHVGALPAGKYTFLLLWVDGSIIASANFEVL